MRKIVSLALTGLLCAQPLWAQPESYQPLDGTAGRSLQAGDQLEINILTLPELEKKYTIRADGTFYHPFAGEVHAAGKTLAKLETELRLRLKKQLKNPTFRLGVSSLADKEAAVLGEVHSQGKFKIVAGTSVLDLLAQAGGVSDKADRDNAVILRGGQKIPLDLGPSGQAALAKMEVRSGDILYVNRGLRVGVSGEVQEKGIYAVSSKSTRAVEDAVKAAGGAKETAALNRVEIIRPTSSKPIVVNLKSPDAGNSVALEDGDMVVVPARKAVVLGAVSKPGNLPLVGADTLLDVVSQAGLSQAKIDSIVVVRAVDVVAGNDKKEIYNIEGGMQEGQNLVNVPIQDGDLVYVPTKEQESSLLTGSTGIMSIIYMARSLFAF